MLIRSMCILGLSAYLKYYVLVLQITKHVSREIICHSNFCHPHVVQFKVGFRLLLHLPWLFSLTSRIPIINCLTVHLQDVGGLPYA